MITNLDKRFILRMGSLLHQEDLDRFVDAHNRPPNTSIRINPAKVSPDITSFKSIPWSRDGWLLPERPLFTLDPLFHSGSYYVQESSSMIIDHVITQVMDNEQPIKVLDMCAAPGGKSTLISSMLPKSSVLICNEAIPGRVPPLLENIVKWGSLNTIVTQNDPEGISLNEFFDIILVDAPCSGEGLFRKEPGIRKAWSEDLIKLCSFRQRRILGNAVRLLKPGGYLIYTTCTYAPEENQHNIKWIKDDLKLLSVEIETPDEWNIQVDDDHGLHLYPHSNDGEGFFAACLKKPGQIDYRRIPNSNQIKELPRNQLNIISHWAEPGHDIAFTMNGDHVLAGEQGLFNDFEKITRSCNVKLYGAIVGALKRDILIPHHHLSMVPGLPARAVRRLDVDEKIAIQYLKREHIDLKADKSPTRQLITYLNQPLGWIKPLDQRINNYYPSNWRIRM